MKKPTVDARNGPARGEVIEHRAEDEWHTVLSRHIAARTEDGYARALVLLMQRPEVTRRLGVV